MNDGFHNTIWDLVKYHAIPSLTGWIRYAFSYPKKAVELLWHRASFSITRRMSGCWIDPFGFLIRTHHMLISYWSMFVERELWHNQWVVSVRDAKSRPCVIDVGANAGVFVHFILTINPKSKVIAIEPQQILIDQIMEYAKARNADVQGIVAACSERPGMGVLQLNEEGDTTASLERDFMPHSGSISVPLVTLDEIAPKDEIVDVLKIDAEGHDIAVLKGARSMLARVHHILIELHREGMVEEVVQLLGSGWEMIRLGPSDYLFVNHSMNSPPNE